MRLAALLLLAMPTAAQDVSSRTITLREAYELALRRSEALAIRQEAVVEARARGAEMLAAVKPSFAAVATEMIQDQDPGDPFASRFNERTRFDAKLTGRQPLFAGFREFLAYRAALAQGRATALDKERAEGLLCLDVARAYLELLGARKDIQTREAALQLTGERVVELKARERIGRSRKSEVLAAESQLAQLEAQLASERGRERGAGLALRFLTGLEDDLLPADVESPEAAQAEPFLRRAEGRPDVEARSRELEMERLLAASIWRKRWPTLGVDGNYYLKRSGIQEGVHWDVLFTLNQPLYSGGTTGAQAAQAEARARMAERALELARRSARREVLDAHQGLSTALASLKALEKSATLAEANTRAQAEDYRLGLVTNLDVLGVLNAIQEARLRLEQERRRAVLARVELEVAAGGRLP